MNKFGIGALSALGIGCIGAGAFCLAENAYSYGQQNATTQKDDVGQDVPAKLEDVLATFSGEYPGVVPEIVDVGEDKYVVLMGQSSYLYDNNTGDLTTINVVTQYNFFARVGDVPYFVSRDDNTLVLYVYNGISFEPVLKNTMYLDTSYTVLYTTDDLILCYLNNSSVLCVCNISQCNMSYTSMLSSSEYFVKNNKMYFFGKSGGDRVIKCLDLDTCIVSVGPIWSTDNDFYGAQLLIGEQDEYFQIVYQRDDVLYRYDGSSEIPMLTISEENSIRYCYFYRDDDSYYRPLYMNDYLICFCISNVVDEQRTDTMYVYDIRKSELISLVSFGNNMNFTPRFTFYNTGVYVNMYNGEQCYNAIYDINFGLISVDSTSDDLSFVQFYDDALFYCIGAGEEFFYKTESVTLSTNICRVYSSDFSNIYYNSSIGCDGDWLIQKNENKYLIINSSCIYFVEIDDTLNFYTYVHLSESLVMTPQYVLFKVNSNIGKFLYVFDHTQYSATESTQIVWTFIGDYEFDSIDGDIVKLTSANGSEYELDLTTKTLTCTKLNITATN